MLGLLILASDDDTVLTLARKLEEAAALRVAPPRGARTRVGEGVSLSILRRVSAAGLQPLDRFDVRFEVASAPREEPIPVMSFRRAAARDDLWAGEMRGIVVDGVPVLLVSLDDGVHAYEDRCLHKGVALSSGRLSGTRLVCSVHAWEYDAVSGRGLNPARDCLRSFPVRESWVRRST